MVSAAQPIFEVFCRVFLLLFEGSVVGQVSHLVLLSQVFAKRLNEG